MKKQKIKNLEAELSACHAEAIEIAYNCYHRQQSRIGSDMFGLFKKKDICKGDCDCIKIEGIFYKPLYEDPWMRAGYAMIVNPLITYGIKKVGEVKYLIPAIECKKERKLK